MADIKNFRKLMSKMESENNTNVNHSPTPNGTAIGEYGLMPPTIRDIASKGTTAVDNIVAKSNDEMIKILLKENPQLADMYMEKLATPILNKVQDNPDLAATAWLYGQNLSPAALQEKLNNDKQYQSRINDAIESEHLQSSMPNLNDILKQRYNPKPFTPSSK